MFIECRHIFPRGTKCEAAALRGQTFCYFHDRQRKHRPRAASSGEPSSVVHRLPMLEDPDSIQQAISDVVSALAANRIDVRRAQVLLYGLQIAAGHQKKVRNHSSFSAVRSTWEHTDGSDLGPIVRRSEWGDPPDQPRQHEEDADLDEEEDQEEDDGPNDGSDDEADDELDQPGEENGGETDEGPDGPPEEEDPVITTVQQTPAELAAELRHIFLKKLMACAAPPPKKPLSRGAPGSQDTGLGAPGSQDTGLGLQDTDLGAPGSRRAVRR